ncbi:MAG: enoyl-CoA hydratase/isomerase family protein [Actinomycetota bacterium]
MSAVAYEVRDRIAYLTLDRPAALNAIDEDVLGSLAAAIEHAGADHQVKALVIAGAGDAFCAGLDTGLLERAFDDPHTSAMSSIASSRCCCGWRTCRSRSSRPSAASRGPAGSR